MFFFMSYFKFNFSMFNFSMFNFMFKHFSFQAFDLRLRSRWVRRRVTTITDREISLTEIGRDRSAAPASTSDRIRDRRERRTSSKTDLLSMDRSFYHFFRRLFSTITITLQIVDKRLNIYFKTDCVHEYAFTCFLISKFNLGTFC